MFHVADGEVFVCAWLLRGDIFHWLLPLQRFTGKARVRLLGFDLDFTLRTAAALTAVGRRRTFSDSALSCGRRVPRHTPEGPQRGFDQVVAGGSSTYQASSIAVVSTRRRS